MLISVIMPYFRKEKYIFSSVKSVLNQSYKKFELILVDDEVTESSSKILKKIQFLDKRIILLKNKKNLGAGLSRNKAIIRSRGKYIAFIDADDIWKKDKLKIQLNFMERISSKISHTSYIIHQNNRPQKIKKARKLNFKDLLHNCDIGLSTVMINKKLIKNIKFPSIKTKEDYILWLKITKKGISVDALNKQLTLWNDTQNSLSSSTLQKLADGYKVYRKYLKLNFITSLYYISCLSLNYIKKNL